MAHLLDPAMVQPKCSLELPALPLPIVDHHRPVGTLKFRRDRQKILASAVRRTGNGVGTLSMKSVSATGSDAVKAVQALPR